MTGIEIISGLGTAFSALSSIQQGKAANKAAGYQAAQLEQRASQERAASQRSAIEERRQANLIQSSARAKAVAGGASLSSPGISNIIGDLDYQGDYRFQSRMYEGEESARGSEGAAASARLEGKMAKQAGTAGALGTVTNFALSSTGKSLYEKYGGGVTVSKPRPAEYKGLTFRGV
jgi:hypothetical protein